MKQCWKDKSEFVAETFGLWSEEHLEAMANDGSCMLEDGHEGEHVFTPDNQILITILPDETE